MPAHQPALIASQSVSFNEFLFCQAISFHIQSRNSSVEEGITCRKPWVYAWMYASSSCSQSRARHRCMCSCMTVLLSVKPCWRYVDCHLAASHHPVSADEVCQEAMTPIRRKLDSAREKKKYQIPCHLFSNNSQVWMYSHVYMEFTRIIYTISALTLHVWICSAASRWVSLLPPCSLACGTYFMHFIVVHCIFLMRALPCARLFSCMDQVQTNLCANMLCWFHTHAALRFRYTSSPKRECEERV
jgi:hypothetical protein